MSGYNVSADDPTPSFFSPSPSMTTTPAYEPEHEPDEMHDLHESDHEPEVDRTSLTPAQIAEIDLLTACIDAEQRRSGQYRSAQRFAVQVLVRDPRTVRRWLAGAQAMPAIVVDKLHAYLAESAALAPAASTTHGAPTGAEGEE